MRWAELAALGCAVVLVHCAGSRPRLDDPSELRLGQLEPRETVTEAALQRPSDESPAVLTRAVLTRAVHNGFGTFLSTVTVSPVLSHGRFVGFRLDHARHLTRWNTAGMALRTGDIVTRVNGRSVERPDDALAVFEGLTTATELRVEVLRDGSPRELHLAVLP